MCVIVHTLSTLYIDNDTSGDNECTIGKTGLVILLVVNGILIVINIIMCSELCDNKCKNKRKSNNTKSTDEAPMIENEGEQPKEKNGKEKKSD